MPDISTLSNGLTVASVTMPEVESVSINVWVKTGSRYETAETAGISHLLEHMVFKGTRKRSALDIAESLDNVGGALNAYTSREHTVYYAKVLKGDAELAVDVLSDLVQNATFLPEELVRERGVVLQEIAQSFDTPDDIVFDYYQQAAFPGQSIGHPILGSEEIIEGLTEEHLREHVRTFYHTGGIVITAAGNITHAQVLKLAERYFGDMPKAEAPQPPKAVYKGGESRTERELEQIHLVMGMEAYSHHAPEYYTQQLLALILGGGMSSRLFQEIREKRGLAYSISCFSSCYDDTGMFGIYSGTSDAQVQELIEVTCNELKRSVGTLTPEELQRAKTQVKAGMLMARERPSARAEELGRHLMVHGRYIPMEELLARVEEVTLPGLHNLMEQLLSQSSLTIATIGNVKNIEPFEKTAARLR
ncbi:MAG: hypothetical protein K0R63_1473 [Rickettsiales bacterium]|jgi:predicted Zn-dependent peptidase|nr:hypothetical protein [Rickettsiales bacterium]